MEFVVITLLVINFLFIVVAIFLLMNITNAIKAQSYSSAFFKSQFSYLYERLDGLREKADKSAEDQRRQMEQFESELREQMNKFRTENFREIDGIKYLLRQIAPKKLQNLETVDDEPTQALPPKRQRSR